MLIDNFTVIAQLINFLILVWLLKRFLYQPVLRAIDAREARLQEQQDQARNEHNQAQELKRRLEKEERELQQQRDTLVEQARTEAREQKEKDLAQARSEIETQKEQWREQLHLEQQQIHAQLRTCVLKELNAAVRSALHDLADQELEQQMIRHFIKRLEHLEPEQREELQHISTTSGPQIKTSFALDDSTQEHLRSTLNTILKLNKINFSHDPAMPCGIKLEWEDYRLEWSLDTYLEQIQQGLQHQLEDISAPGREHPQEQDQASKSSSSAQQERST